jgi:hypothetical protein
VCVGWEESQSLQPKGVFEKPVVIGSAQSRIGSNTLKYLKNCHKECTQEFSPKDLRIFQSSSGEIGYLKLSKKISRGLVL